MKYAEEHKVLECYRRQKDTVYKLAYSYCRSSSQAEDVFQEVFYKYMLRWPKFKNPEHEKAWFIRTTINVCKDLLKSKWHCDVQGLEAWDEGSAVSNEPWDAFDDLREVILALPEKYRLPIHLYYYEEYSVREIAKMLHRSESAIQTQLQRGRDKIRQIMEGSDEYDVRSNNLQRSNV